MDALVEQGWAGFGSGSDVDGQALGDGVAGEASPGCPGTSTGVRRATAATANRSRHGDAAPTRLDPPPHRGARAHRPFKKLRLRGTVVHRGAAAEVEELVLADGEVRFAVRSVAVSAARPGCGRRSSRLYCYYRRRCADRPVEGRRVRLVLRALRFVCGNDRCGRRTFAGQIEALTFRHARRTTALVTQLTDRRRAVPGRPAGGRISGRLAMTTCRDTLLRLIRALPVPSSGLVPRLGVDEYPVRRGRTCATVLVDMDTHRPVDVLADSTANAFATRLRDHPEMRTVCRDRA
ncbi:hypothetical protein ACIPYS_21375 [Kitasatospora sp. NPDC089913]|uniref:hypothetical protein n=1 Tax=Kitasatospora sp. NPDC089913 TaxID=3364080 RepID=UPI0037F3F4E8